MAIETDASRTYSLTMSPTATFDYKLAETPLLRLYSKAKDRQWDARTYVDWDEKLDEENPLSLPISTFPLARTHWFRGLSQDAKIEVKREYQGWMVSQFLHGEQFGILLASRIALEASDHDSKLFAAMQAVDEARHLESYIRLSEKIGVRYALSAPFGQFLDELIAAKDLDLVHLGAQIIAEGIGLAAFSQLQGASTSPLVTKLYGRIVEDEARHVAYGRLYLTPLYRSLSSSELRIREEFLIHACGLLNERFRALEVWERFGLDAKDAIKALRKSGTFRIYQKELLKQIVPIVKSIGLWSENVQKCFGAMGVSEM